MAVIAPTRVLLGIGFNKLWKFIFDCLRKRGFIILSRTTRSENRSSSTTTMAADGDDDKEEVWVLMNEDLVWEVVLRVPTKSLMRFKCVSKHWNSIIRDPVFDKSYVGRSRGLLITHVNHHRIGGAYYRNTRRFFYASLLFNNNNNNNNNNMQASHHLSVDIADYPYKGYNVVTNIEKSLIGLSCDDYNFALCNLATKQLLTFPEFVLEEYSRYYIGFEPVTEVFKILRFFEMETFSEDESRLHIEICTLGGGGGLWSNHIEWRSLDPTLYPDHIIRWRSMQFISIDGILYFLTYRCISGYGGEEPEFSISLIVFYLITETFSEIIIETFSGIMEIPGQTFWLVQFGGSPALINLPTNCDQMGIIWTNKNDDKTLMKMQTVDLMGMTDLTYAGTLPTGEMLLAPKIANANPLPIYKYNHIENKLLNWIQLEGYVPECDDNGGDFVLISYHEDNILPLDCLIRSQ